MIVRIGHPILPSEVVSLTIADKVDHPNSAVTIWLRQNWEGTAVSTTCYEEGSVVDTDWEPMDLEDMIELARSWGEQFGIDENEVAEAIASVLTWGDTIVTPQ